MPKNKIYIPTFISSIDYKPARVLPHIYFYNGVKISDTYYIETLDATGSVKYSAQSSFPYFDNYEGSTPTTGSRSLLFFNETAPYGDAPTGSLYSEYWETYVSLLYNPRTRFIEASAIIPLADYFKMELNDIVEWRGNYYHLRAINDYNLSNGECDIQLLGPVLADTIANVLPDDVKCSFNFDILPAPTPTSSLWDLHSCTSSVSYSAISFDTTSSLVVGDVIKWDGASGCYSLTSSLETTASISGAIVLNIYDNCDDCTGSVPPPTSCVSCSAILSDTYSGTNQYTYPQIDICSNVSSSFTLEWTSYDRPNRFAVYDSTGQVASTGWKGYANYAGPWGLSLNTATNGTLSVTFASSTGRYLLIDAGPAGPSGNSDSWTAKITC